MNIAELAGAAVESVWHLNRRLFFVLARGEIYARSVRTVDFVDGSLAGPVRAVACRVAEQVDASQPNEYVTVVEFLSGRAAFRSWFPADKGMGLVAEIPSGAKLLTTADSDP